MSATSRTSAAEISAEALSASGRTGEKLRRPALQSKMKCDPEGYETELALLHGQFNSSLEIFHQQATLNLTSVDADPAVARDLGDRAMFLAHVAPFYPKQLADFLRSAARTLPPSLRCHVAQALILLINRKIVDIGEMLALLMELQTLGDRALRKFALSHVGHSIGRINQKHKNEAKIELFRISYLLCYRMQEDEAKANNHLSLCVIFMEGRCGLTIEQ